MYDTDAPDHVCHIDCQLIIREDGGRSHIRYAAAPNTAAGRYQYDSNRKILNMGRGARRAMRATGQDDTRTNREWNYARKLFKDAAAQGAHGGKSVATIDAEYRDNVNAVFGPNRRPYVKRSIRSRARFNAQRESVRQTLNRAAGISSQAGLASFREGMSKDILKSVDWEIYKHSRPAYLPQSEHDPNL